MSAEADGKLPVQVKDDGVAVGFGLARTVEDTARFVPVAVQMEHQPLAVAQVEGEAVLVLLGVKPERQLMVAFLLEAVV